MADIAISSGAGIRPYRSPWGQPEIRYGLESTAQSFVYGDILQLDKSASTASHRIAKATVSNSTITSTAIIGVAAQPASSVVDAKVPYYAASPFNEFWGRTRNGVLAETNIGSAYGLNYDSTNKVTLVDLGNTASTSMRVIVTELVDNIGDSGGAVIFKFGCPNGSTNTFGLAIAR